MNVTTRLGHHARSVLRREHSALLPTQPLRMPLLYRNTPFHPQAPLPPPTGERHSSCAPPFRGERRRSFQALRRRRAEIRRPPQTSAQGCDADTRKARGTAGQEASASTVAAASPAMMVIQEKLRVKYRSPRSGIDIAERRSSGVPPCTGAAPYRLPAVRWSAESPSGLSRITFQ
jgi:hypothetical protein